MEDKTFTLNGGHSRKLNDLFGLYGGEGEQFPEGVGDHIISFEKYKAVLKAQNDVEIICGAIQILMEEILGAHGYILYVLSELRRDPKNPAIQQQSQIAEKRLPTLELNANNIEELTNELANILEKNPQIEEKLQEVHEKIAVMRADVQSLRKTIRDAQG